MSFDYDGGGPAKGGTARLVVDGAEVARGRIERTVPFIFSMSGETLDVGIDVGSTVGPYPSRFPFTGTIDHVEIDLRSPRADEHRDQVDDGQVRGAISSQ